MVTRMSQHLKRKHKMKSPAAIKEGLKLFSKHTGNKSKRPMKPKTKKARKPAQPSTKPSASASLASKTSSKRKASSPSSLEVPEKKRQRRREDESTTETESDSDESWHSSGTHTSEEPKESFLTKHLGDVQADVDDIQTFAEDDADDYLCEPVDGKKWKDVYSDENLHHTVRHHFLCKFFQYLQHVEGGQNTVPQALINTRHVAKILEDIDPTGEGLKALIQNNSLDIWEKFALPRLSSKKNTGDTLKVYLRSLELFADFVEKRLFYDPRLISENAYGAIVGLLKRLPNYRKTIHKRTAVHHTTRKVEESFQAITTKDFAAYANGKGVQWAIKLLGEAINTRPLTKKEFVAVRDYLLVTLIYQNGSRPGALENALVSRFEKATWVPATKSWPLIVDDHKTTRHEGPAEIVFDDQMHRYLRIFISQTRRSHLRQG